MPSQEVCKIELPRYFADHMILQQQCPNLLHGRLRGASSLQIILERLPEEDKASSSSRSGIIFKQQVEAQERGLFFCELPPLTASFDRYRLTLSSKNCQVYINNILIGEVWLCLGSSNMAMPANLTDVKPLCQQFARNPYVRLFKQNHSGLFRGENSYHYAPVARVSAGSWLSAKSPLLPECSAIGLSFAYKLQATLNLPVAVYDLACLDTSMHNWLSTKIVRKQTKWVDKLRHAGINCDNLQPLSKATINAGKDIPTIELEQVGSMFNHKIAPYSNLSVRGILWQAGEREVEEPSFYVAQLKALSYQFSKLLRAPKQKPAFIYSQLSPACFIEDSTLLSRFNEALVKVRRSLALPAGLVSVYDLPGDYHQASATDSKDNKDEIAKFWCDPAYPKAKRKIGERMARLALGLSYNKDVPSSAAECVWAETVGNKMMLEFANVGKKLQLNSTEHELKGFWLRGSNTNYLPAKAKLLYGFRVMVWHEEISEPVACSYAFSDFNQTCNLCGDQLHPVLPFRLENSSPNYQFLPWLSCDRLEIYAVAEGNPGLYPLWQTSSEHARFTLKKHTQYTKNLGNHSLLLSYSHAEAHPLQFGPILNYDSAHGPLDLHSWQSLEIHLFNSEHRRKALRLIIKTHETEYSSELVTIEDKLDWQRLEFSLQEAGKEIDLSAITDLQFELVDGYGQGNLYIDRINLYDIISE